MGRLLGIIVGIILALCLLLPIAAGAYVVSLHREPVILDFNSLPGELSFLSFYLTPPLSQLCGVCAGVGAGLMLLLAILFSLAFRGSARRAADRQVSLLKSKLLERDEEIERLRYRVRHGSMPPEEAAELRPAATHPLPATEAEQQ
ncbi:MAG: hypothetical protein QM328_16060 [Acidobacteriota bacterium]|nr:hypothetical protein [Acidobacteriota bacterium]